MALIEWTERLALHIDEIDRQHQELVAILNDLGLAMSDGRDRESVSWTLGALSAYTKFHFGFEEKLLAQHEYPGSHEHTLEHRMFVRTLGDFRAAHARGTAGLSVGVLAFLGDWLSNHMTGTDRRYVTHLTACRAGHDGLSAAGGLLQVGSQQPHDRGVPVFHTTEAVLA